MENRVHCATLVQFAALIAHFQQLGLAFTAHTTGDCTYYIDVTGY